MKQIVSALGIVCVIACGGSDDDGDGDKNIQDAGTTNDIELCPESEGSRLKFVKFVGESEQTERTALYDNQLQTTCRPNKYPTNDGSSEWACVPPSNGGDVFFSDNACENSFVHFRDELFVKDYVPTQIGGGCQGHPLLYNVGNVLEQAPGAGYQLNASKQCVQAMLPTEGVFLSSSGVVSIDDLVRFDEDRFQVGRFGTMLLNGNDGSSFCDTINYSDSELETTCQLVPDDSGAWQCTPFGAFLTEGFSDLGCSSSVLAGSYNSSCTQFPFGRHTVEVDECTSKTDVYRVATNPMNVYSDMGGSCQLKAGESYPVGDKLPDDQIGRFTEYSDPSFSGRLQRRFLVSDDGFTVDRGWWWDNKLGLQCEPSQPLTNGESRCLPAGAANVRDFYSDSECTETIALVKAATCDQQPNFGRRLEDEVLQYWELSLRSEPAYEMRRLENNQIGCGMIAESTYELGAELSVASLPLLELVTYP